MEWNNSPISSCIVAIIRQEVVVELPKDVQRDPAVGSQHAVVGLPKDRLELVQSQVSA